MTVTELISTLRAQGIRISAHDNELEVDAPQGALTPEIRDELANRKGELLRLLSWSRRADVSAELPLESVARHEDLPLSWSQQRLWFLDQLEPNSSAYNISWTVRLTGELNEAGLQRALNSLVQRHESLRTIFPARDGSPRQQIISHLDIPITIEDMQGVSDEKFRARLGVLAAGSFDLAVGPLLRVFLIRLSPTEHVLLVLIHHIVADGASMRVLFRELAAFYDAELGAKETALAELPVQYADYAVWQRKWLDGAEQDRQSDYWRNQLAGLPPLLELPTDRPRSAAMRYRGASVLRAIPAGLADALRQLGRAQGATLFMVMLSAFYVLLLRYTGRTDLVVGTPMGGRPRTELEGLIGFFINTVVLRADLNGDPSFNTLLATVRSVALESHAHQELPFEKLVEILQPERELSYSPVFQVMFDLQEEPRWQLPVRNLEVVPEVVFSSRTSSFDLTLSVRQAENGLDAMFEYDTDLFDESTIERMAEHYQNLLEAIVLDPDELISRLPLLNSADQNELVSRWGSLSADYPATESLLTRVAAMAEHQPEATALESGNTACSYAELNCRVNQLANLLLQKGLGSGAVVALCAARSLEFFIAELAILKIGAAVLPLDPHYPLERLEFMLRDSNASQALVADEFRTVFSADFSHNSALKVAMLSEIFAMASTQPVSNPSAEVLPTDVAFLLYTSGSTGQPKGVELNHRGFVNYIYQLGRKTALSPDDRILQFASPSFDIAIEESFAALFHGAALVLRDESMADSMQAFVAGCAQNNISWVSLPTAWWHELCASLETESMQLPEQLRCVVIGGEKAEHQAFKVWHRQVGSAKRLLNTYGPTEASIVATWCELTHLSPDALGDLPIGNAIPNVQAWVLDEYLQPLPAGVPGELYIGGIGVANGYHERDSLTASAFVADPFALLPGELLYKTGDRARYTGDGRLMFLGRNDQQIKLRGHRIEPLEIEALLGSYAEVSSAVVVLHVASDMEARLVAYVVTDSSIGAELKARLAETLPAYMVPSAVVIMDELPVTPNGKTDRQHLARRKPVYESAQIFVAPRNAAEMQLAEIWANVLGRESISSNDNFFALGGHSLLATRVVARVRDVFGQDLPLRILFSHPTIAGLALYLEQATASAQLSGVAKYDPAEGLPPLSWTQERLWLLDQLEPNNVAYSLPWAARLCGDLQVAFLQTAIDQIVDRHSVLRTRFAEDGGEAVQIVAPRLMVPVQVEKLHGASHVEIQQRLQQLAEVSFDLSTGPLLRAHLLEVGRDDYVLLLLMHHIVADGWSIGLISKELSTTYRNLTKGAQTRLPALRYQYVDYASWQRSWLKGDELARQVNYWSSQLKDAPALLELPTDFSRPATQGFRGAWVSADLEKNTLDKLQQLAISKDASLFMVLLAAFKALVVRHSGITDVLVGTPTAGRVRTELEDMVGCFLNTLVLRSRIEPTDRFDELLDGVRQTTLDAYDHQDLSFERLIEIIKPERSVAHAPIVQLMFNLHNASSDRLDLGDVGVETFNIDRDTAKFDLSAAIVEGPDGLQIGFEYSTDLFARRTVVQMLKHYLRFLTAVAEHPNTCIADVQLADPYVPPIPQHHHDPFAGHVLDGSIIDRFDWVVEKFAERPAVQASAELWTYAELNARANAVAARIDALEPGMGSDGWQRPIGLLLNHDAFMLAGLLGVLKSGRSYVPLDRQAPVERLRSIITTGDLAAVVTVAELADDAPALDGLPVIQIATSEVDLSQPAVFRATRCSADSLAYVLFTSGSTGKPKGVMQTHRNVLHHVRTYSNALRISENDRISLFASYGFDAAVMDIFGSVLNGACLLPVDVLEIGQRNQPARFFNDQQISIFHATPTVYRFLLHSAADSLVCKSVRAVVLGGEEAVAADFELFCQHFRAPAVFVNGLGPSESTLATQFIANHDTELFGGVVPVGSAVADTETLLVDSAGEVTAGVGELAIRSAYVSTGYWGEPELSTQRFISDVQEAGVTLYRSGDRARMLPDGQLAYCGRVDEQIKIRGHRIEPAEVEAAINALGSVRRCVVVANVADNAAVVLVAYVVPQLPGTIQTAEMRSALQEVLPDYLVPAVFVELSELPLTSNGKLDRNALPAPDWDDLTSRAGIAPRTSAEKQLVAIWSELLSLSNIGIHDDFFQLGGHSLLATQVVARIRKSMGHAFSLRVLFSHPTVAQLGALLESSAPAVDEYPLRPREQLSILPPLSWSQQRLWFLDRLEPDSFAYNLHWAAELKGSLDSDHLQLAVNDLVVRHESLRTVFADGQDEPVQIIQSDVNIHVQIQSLTAASDERLHSRIVELIRQPFDLKTGPLLRCYLIQRGDGNSVLLFVMPHIVSDGWSMGILFRELAELYASRMNGRLPDLPSLPVQYADYAVWQRQWLSGAELERQTRFWQRQLREAPAVLDLPLDSSRPPVQRFRGAWISREFDAGLLQQLNALAAEQGATLFMVLLAAFKVLLARYTGQEDILIGTPVAGRSRVELEGLIGFFLNTLVLRTRLDANPDFIEVLQRVRRTTLDAYEFQDLPFEKLLEVLQPARSTAHSPVVQVMFNLHNEPAEGLQLEGLTVTPFAVDRGTAKFDLSVALVERTSGLLAGFEYNTDLFARQTIERMLDHYGELLGAIVANSELKVADYLLSSALTTGRNVVAVTNDHESVFATDDRATLVSRFAEMVVRHAERPAVSIDDCTWTYAQLDAMSGSIAASITAARSSGRRVGVLLGHNESAIAALLGVMKAGCAYVPLDQYAPSARLSAIVADAGLTLIISDRERAGLIPQLEGVERLNVDTLDYEDVAEKLTEDSLPDDLAYILFTSGSTGVPKGVMQTQKNVLQQVRAYSKALQISCDDRLSMLPAYGFDAAVMDIYGALLNGACLYPLDVRDEQYSGALLDQMSAEQITLLHATPTVFRFLMRQKVCRHDLTKIRAVILGGEEALKSDFDLFKRQFAPPTKFINGLGPSESTIALQFVADHATQLSGSVVPVGLPVDGVDVSLIDEAGQPAGISGEIVLESSCLSVGYWNQPELSSDVFTMSSVDAMKRRYRTGDRARYLPDGQLVFLGRRDDQVKIRGHRVELAEIESVLASHPEVERCAVVMHSVVSDSYAPPEPRLVAYVITHSELTTDQLRSYIRSVLPDYMLPAAFVVLNDLPLLANGKLNRAELPAPDWSRDSNQEFVPPGTTTEKRLASIWSDVLGVDQIGVHDDFFELGGHSLMAAQLVSRITDAMQIGLPLRRLFDSPTIAELAEHVDALQWALQASQQDDTTGC